MNRKEHILKFKPVTAPESATHNLPLYHDVYTFFKEFFGEQKTVNVVFYKPQDFIEDLSARFNKEYAYDDVIKMLKMGYPYIPSTGSYEILRSDFYLIDAK